MFETTILPVVERFAKKCFKDDADKVALAIMLAWWAWSRRKEDFPPSIYARIGVRKALQGRDLPGMQTKVTDVWRQLKMIGGAGMEGLSDRRPGPARQVEKRELTERLFARLKGRKRIMVDMLIEGRTAQEVSKALNVGPTRIHQMRAEVKAEFDGL